LNSTGYNNNAAGFESLYSNTSGFKNNAVGFQALYSNTTADNNNAMGYGALFENTTGIENNAVGSQALYNNVGGTGNNAQGYGALFNNMSGDLNSAVGSLALYNNTTGGSNAAIGTLALYKNTTGGNNVALGYEAGYNQTTGSNNIYIDHLGVAAESGVIRIGTPSTQTVTYIAGIENAKITGNAVYVTPTGQLGVVASSERYKTGITPIGANTERLQQLRPVSFHLKTDPKGAVQYGLIAEEVDKVYPELVIRDEAGKIQGVHYEELAPILLSEVQQQQHKIDVQAEEVLDLKRQVAKVNDLEHELAEMRTALAALQSKDQLVAQR
jgi:hypothetical protein